MTANIKHTNSGHSLICDNCGNIIVSNGKIPYGAKIKGLKSLWFCCKECAEDYYNKNGKFEYMCNIMKPEN